MTKKWWIIFGITQLTGSALLLYLSRFQVGEFAVADRFSLPAMLVISPGIWAAAGLAQIRGFGWLDVPYGAPIVILSILLNAVCWYSISLILQRRRRLLM